MDTRDSETYAIIGAAMDVHSQLKAGFLEVVYQDALTVEFALRNIPAEREKLLTITYKGVVLPSFYRADFVCFGDVLVECKALRALGSTEEAQVLHYLRATGLTKALLINFGANSLTHKRFILTSPTD